jgi:23S rRNA pseudouridine1911/1915/1917 synthase
MEKTDNIKIGNLVVFKTNQVIAFNKTAGLPVQSDKTGDISLQQLAEIYCKRKLNLVHRLDRPASGVVLFAKNPKAAEYLSSQFRNRTIEKTYLAVVGNIPMELEGTIKHFLKKSGGKNRSIASEEEFDDTTESVLSYKTLGSIENYRLLEIKMLSGYHHQIRSQLGAFGCPVKGDVKYGSRRGNKDRSIHLHAWKLAFNHPVSGERTELMVPPPEEHIWQLLTLQLI